MADTTDEIYYTDKVFYRIKALEEELERTRKALAVAVDAIKNATEYLGNQEPLVDVMAMNLHTDCGNRFFYKDLGITILEHKKDYPVIAKEKRLELALKKIISMEQRICIDPLGEIIDDILAIAKHALNKPVI